MRATVGLVLFFSPVITLSAVALYQSGDWIGVTILLVGLLVVGLGAYLMSSSYRRNNVQSASPPPPDPE